MGQTVFTNARSVVHKGSGGISIVFPDVCKTPSPAGPVPIPYPNIAKTATAKQQVKVASTALKTTGTVATPGTIPSVGGVASNKVMGTVSYKAYAMDVQFEGKSVARTVDPLLANKQTESAQLRNMLNDLNQQLMRLSPGKPEQWQAVLEHYAVAASALYVTITDDD